MLNSVFMFFGCYARPSLSFSTQAITSGDKKDLINSGFVRLRLNFNLMKLDS